MKKIFAIAWKDTIVRFASASEWLFFIVLPIIFTFIFAGGVPTGDEDNRIRLMVVDQANTTISQEIISELEASTAVRPEVLSLAEAQEQFDSRRAIAMLVIPAGLNMESIQKGKAQLDFRQLPNNMDASIAERAVQTTIRRVSSIVSAANLAVDEAKDFLAPLPIETLALA